MSSYIKVPWLRIVLATVTVGFSTVPPTLLSLTQLLLPYKETRNEGCLLI